MNEVQTAASLRGSFFESVLLEVNERGGAMSMEDLDHFTGGRADTNEAIQELQRQSLIEADFDEASLTPFGSRTASFVRQSMVSGARRADMVQRAVLTWLNGRSIEPSSLEEFLVQPESVLAGQQTTPREVQEAGELLKTRRFIYTLNETGWARPTITADGRAALVSDVMISEYGRANATAVTNDFSSKVNFHHSNVAGVISGGQGHAQTVTQTIGAVETATLRSKIAELTEIASNLPDDEHAVALRELMTSLTNEVASDTPRRSEVKELLFKAFGAAATAGGTDIGQHLLHGLSQAAQMVVGG